MLQVIRITAGYGKKTVLKEVSLTLNEAKIASLIGPNGSGKSTLLKTIIGIIKAEHGEIIYSGNRINGSSPAVNVRRGLQYVPQGNIVFNDLSVIENLRMGGYILSDRDAVENRVTEVFELFPIMRERKHMNAGDLSGGEKQMLSFGRALMLRPQLLLLDEPSLGLSRKAVNTAFSMIKHIAVGYGTSILIAEQNVSEVLKISDIVYVMVLGQIVAVDIPENLPKERIKDLFLGTANSQKKPILPE
jgi:branched-chain amino acid transport system ATP-binding protein